MLQENGDEAWLDAILGQLVQTAPRVEALLARHFPGSGGTLYPDAAGNVCVTENVGGASARPASVYARCVTKLGKLVEAFSAAAIDQAAAACIRLAKERTVFACALDLARHPLNPMQRQLFIARMMPSMAPLHRQDDATASCIWLRLWTLHAWVLELRLALALTGGAGRSDQALLQTLDSDLARLLQPEAHWLSVDLCMASATEMVARAPLDVLPVGNLAWPNRLGALLPETGWDARSLGRCGIERRHGEGMSWFRFSRRFAETPNLHEASTRLPHGMRAGA
jgi:hypothetical protein